MSTPTTIPLGPEAQFQRFLGEGVIKIQCCESCNRFVFYPRWLCPACGSSRLNWRDVSGEGEVYSTTTMRRRPQDGGDYNVAIVTLKEGVRLMTRVDADPDEVVRIGMPVMAKIVDGPAQELLLAFTPRGGRHASQ